MHIVTQSASASHTHFSPQLLISAPRIAGLLPARAESLIEPPPLNPHSLTLTDYRLETISPQHHAVLMAVTKNLFRAAVDFLIDQDTVGDMYVAGLNFTGELDELFTPRVEVIKRQPKAKPSTPPFRTVEQMNADLEPLLKDIAETAQRLGWMRKPGQDKGS